MGQASMCVHVYVVTTQEAIGRRITDHGITCFSYYASLLKHSERNCSNQFLTKKATPLP